MEEDNLGEIKIKLKTYERKDIEFNEPEFSGRLILREGSKEEVTKTILNAENLEHSESFKDKYGSIRHNLYFKISNNRTMKLPVIFDKGGKKSLYIITYIMRYRKWHKGGF